MFIPVESFAQFQSLGGLPLAAVDMGFSGKTASTGFAFLAQGDKLTSESRTFAGCVESVAEHSRRHQELALVIEAPLSAAFNTNGNPQARGNFESRPKPRWWSLGAGACMSLAALFFLKRLAEALPRGTTIYLIEGFVVGENSGSDTEVAEALIQSAIGQRPCEWAAPQGANLVSVVDWVMSNSRGAAAPTILIPTFS